MSIAPAASPDPTDLTPPHRGGRRRAASDLLTTVRRTLTRLVVMSVVAFALGVVSYNVTPHLIAAPVAPPPVTATAPERPAGGAAALVAAHDCWTGAAPADMEGVLPGHVVVTVAGGAGPEYRGERMVGLALDQIFHGAPHGLVVHAFCR